MPRTDYQPRYLAFCDAHGLSPDQPPAGDRERIGRNHDFMVWIGAQWRAWRQLNGLAPAAPLSEAQVAAFDAWLAAAPAA
jgi:hypothetical protein